MGNFESQYHTLVGHLLKFAEKRMTRNGNTLSTFNTVLRFDLENEFPCIMGRKMYPVGIFGELAAMLRRPKHVDDFKAWGCNYWEKWAEPDGSIRVDYGNAWFDFNGVDQIAQLKEALVGSPESRRMVISGWRPGADLSLPCCHYAYQFYVRDGKYLDMMWVQRSADLMIGVPSDAVFAAAWMIAICQEFSWLTPGRCMMVFGDTHIYEEHIPGAHKYLEQAVKAETAFWQANPDAKNEDFCNFKPDWIYVSGNPGPSIKFELKESLMLYSRVAAWNASR